jgi:hypothetical protein
MSTLGGVNLGVPNPSDPDYDGLNLKPPEAEKMRRLERKNAPQSWEKIKIIKREIEPVEAFLLGYKLDLLSWWKGLYWLR